MIVGNSIGATNGAILAAPQSGDDTFPAAVDLLEKVWLREMKNRKLHKRSTAWPPKLGKTIVGVIWLLQVLEKTGPGLNAFGPEDVELFNRLCDDLPAQVLPREGIADTDALRGALDGIRDKLQEMLSRPSLIERHHWARVLKKNVDWTRLNAKDTRCYLGCTATDVETGTLAWFWNHAPPKPAPLSGKAGLCVKHVMASSSIWSIYPSTEVDNRWYWDGALLANTPVRPAIDLLLGSESVRQVVVVLMTPFEEALPEESQQAPIEQRKQESCTQPKKEPPGRPSVLDGLKRFMDWMMLGTFREQLARLDEGQRSKVRIVAPSQLQGVVQIIDYAPRELRELRRQGEEDAHNGLGG
jgi:predicted acylesterase/phospholipase RssA